MPNQQTSELILLATNITGCFTLGVAGDKIVRGQLARGVMEVCSGGGLGVTPLWRQYHVPETGESVCHSYFLHFSYPLICVSGQTGPLAQLAEQLTLNQ